jgi:hypothetical protein
MHRRGAASWAVAGCCGPTRVAKTEELPPTIATVKGERSEGGEFVARSVSLTRVDDSVWGAVTFVNERDGSLRIGGMFGADLGGTLVRLNDPDARQSVQSGAGCGGEGNCSPDRRFRVDTVYFTVRFTSGPPACVPGGWALPARGRTGRSPRRWIRP